MKHLHLLVAGGEKKKIIGTLICFHSCHKNKDRTQCFHLHQTLTQPRSPVAHTAGQQNIHYNVEIMMQNKYESITVVIS